MTERLTKAWVTMGLGAVPIAVVAAMALVPAWAADRPAGDKPAAGEAAAGLSLDQRKQLADLQRQFVYKEALSDVWYAAAEEILKFGPDGQKGLLPAMETRLRMAQREYRQAFGNQARRLRAERAAEAAKKEPKGQHQIDRDIQQARRAVLDLLSNDPLDKKDIDAKGDPAMKTLGELLAITRPAVLEASKEIAAQRAALLKLWTLRNRCAPAKGEVGGAKPAAAGKADAGPKPDAAAKADPGGLATIEVAVVAMEELGALLAMQVNPATKKVLEFNATVEDQLALAEAEGVRDLNRIRLLLGLGVVKTDVKLCTAARGHSGDMRTKEFFSHDSPVPGKKTPWDRAARAGTTANAENIAAGTASGSGANQMWFHSPGHFKNMLGNHVRIGMGCDGDKWTQMFGG
jgi:uncharacterized protein YkwD